MVAPTAQELTELAKKKYTAGDFSGAAVLFSSATGQFTAAGDALGAAESANNASVALLKAGRAQEALDAAAGTAEIFAEAGDIRRQAIALSNEAAAKEDLKDDAGALDCYNKANELLKESGDQELRHYVLQSISQLQLRTGHKMEALASMQASLENKKHLSAKEHVLKRMLNQVFGMLRR